jgi:hypothetical protein
MGNPKHGDVGTGECVTHSIERFGTGFAAGVRDFFTRTDHTVLISGGVILLLALIFWCTLHSKEEL